MNIKEKDLQIFTELKNTHPELLFTKNFDTTIIDNMFINTHLENTLTTLAENSSATDLANMLYVMYGNKWDALYNAYEKAYEIIPEFANSEKTTETKKETGESANNRINSVSAYNADDFSNDNKQDNTGTHNINNDNEKTVEKTNGYNVISTFQFLQTTELCSIIFNDVASILFLHIYS